MENLFIGLVAFEVVLLVLLGLAAIARIVLGPDRDLERPWDPRDFR